MVKKRNQTGGQVMIVSVGGREEEGRNNNKISDKSKIALR